MSRNRSIGEKFFRYTAIGLTAAAVMHASYAAEFNSETMKKMGVFLSNFTETGLRNFNLSELTGTDQGIQQIVMFAYNHIRSPGILQSQPGFGKGSQCGSAAVYGS